AHALELGAGDLVAALAVRAVQPDHVGLGAQAQMVTDGALDRGLGPMSATACTAHGRPRISASASLARVKFTMSENRAVRTFQPVHAGKAFVEDDGDIGPSRRFVARTRHRKPYASRQPMISRPMGRRTETSMAPSSRRQQLAALVADRVTDAALAIV